MGNVEIAPIYDADGNEISIGELIARQNRRRDRAFREAEEAISALVDVVARWPDLVPIASDGRCGWIIEELRDQLEARGFENRPTRSSKSTKRVASPQEVQLRIYRRDDFTCQSCGEVGGDLTVDHIVPVSRGGGNELDNLQALCRSCNAAKGDA